MLKISDGLRNRSLKEVRHASVAAHWACRASTEAQSWNLRVVSRCFGNRAEFLMNDDSIVGISWYEWFAISVFSQAVYIRLGTRTNRTASSACEGHSLGVIPRLLSVVMYQAFDTLRARNTPRNCATIFEVTLTGISRDREIRVLE